MWNVNKSIVYGARIIDKTILKSSTSGGVFSPISDLIIKNDGLVCGAVYSSDYKVKHVISASPEVRNEMRMAKYVQSNMGDIISKILKHLEEGKIVLFSGTPCQVAAVKNVVSARHLEKKLVTIDIICHGVPSPKLFKEHIDMIEKKYGAIKSYIFRDKQKGWRGQNVTIITESGIVPDKDAKLYSSLYFNSLIIRPSCYKCPFASVHREGDITIGDYWGILKENKRTNDNLGISQIMLNTQKGVRIFDEIKQELEYFEIKSNNYIQPNMKKPTERSMVTDAFWKVYNKKGIQSGKKFLKTLKYRMIPYRILNKLFMRGNKHE